MYQGKFVEFDVVRDKSEHIIDKSVILLINAEVAPEGAYQKVKHVIMGFKVYNLRKTMVEL